MTAKLMIESRSSTTRLLGGHVHVAHDAIISAALACTISSIGCFSFTGGLSRILHDVAPYMLADGILASPFCQCRRVKALNFDADAIAALSEAHRVIYRGKINSITRVNGYGREIASYLS